MLPEKAFEILKALAELEGRIVKLEAYVRAARAESALRAKKYHLHEGRGGFGPRDR